jgi:hypothetical protein
MSTKQAVIFAFMLVFLITTVVTVSLWFHFALEFDVKDRALKVLESRKSELATQRDKLHGQLVDMPSGLDAKVGTLTEATNQHIQMYLRDPANSRWKMYVDQGGDFKEPGGEIAVKWGPKGTVVKEWQAVSVDWQKENQEIADSRTKLANAEKTSVTQTETSHNELRDQLDEEERRKREEVLKRKEWVQEVSLIRDQSEETQERVNEVTRELERVEGDDKDADVIFASKSTCTIDLGYVHGAKEGLKFAVFGNKGSVPFRKGTIRLVDIRSTSSDAIILPETGVQLYDSITGWVAPDSRMRYSVFSSGGADGTEPQQLERVKSKREQIREQRAELLRREREVEGGVGTDVLSNENSSEEPQFILGKGMEPIAEGDWVSNTEFHRIVPHKQFEKVLIAEVIEMGDISLNPQTFCFSPMVKPYRQEYLKRLCERNLCRAASQMSAEVDFLVTSPDTTRIDLLKQRLGDLNPEAMEAMEADANLPPDRLALVHTYKMLTEGRKHGAKAISESQLEEYFLDRGRKKEMLSGRAKQPGQSVFFVVGETRNRSVRETNLYIEELGGVLAANMDEKVDILVAGEGLDDAKWDKETRRLYYAGQPAPATAIPFADAVKLLGLRLLREDDLQKFFGR